MRRRVVSEVPQRVTCGSPRAGGPRIQPVAPRVKVPNNPVDMDSKGLSACYPRRTFYPLSDTLSTQQYRITIAYPASRVAEAGVPASVSWGTLLHVLHRVTTRATPTLRTSVTFWEAAAPAKLPTMLGPRPRTGKWVDRTGQPCFMGVSPTVVAHRGAKLVPTLQPGRPAHTTRV